jgi:hypothetical protein
LNHFERTQEHSDVGRDAPGKQAYRSPEFKRFGAVAVVTRGNSSGSLSDIDRMKMSGQTL